MTFNCISSEDWREFERRYPSAVSFLLSASLRGEWHYLKSRNPAHETPERNAWIASRLSDLAQIFGPDGPAPLPHKETP
jgi:hypothetical protein